MTPRALPPRPGPLLEPGGRAARVLLPRPAGRAGTLPALLGRDGVIVAHHPLVELEVEAGPAVQRALQDLAAGRYTDLVVTSRSGVAALLAASGLAAPGAEGAAGLSAAVGTLAVAPGTRVVAVGPSTAAALADAGVATDLVAEGSGAALVAAMPAPDGERTVLFPASAAAAPTVPDGLRAAGYAVDRVEAYRPRPVELPEPVARDLATGGFAAIVLTSPMIARHAAAAGIGAGTAVVTIGSPTSSAARAAGLPVAVQAAAPDDEHLAAAVRSVLGIDAAGGTERPPSSPRSASPAVLPSGRLPDPPRPDRPSPSPGPSAPGP